jgi:hypothetical protein
MATTPSRHYDPIAQGRPVRPRSPRRDLMFKPRQPDSSVIFLHIPKTAGTSLTKILGDQFGLNNTRWLSGSVRVRPTIAAGSAHTRLYVGHQGFGLHAYTGRTTDYITMLRDPIERVISHYWFVHDDLEHYLYDMVVKARMPMADYIANPMRTPELDNGMVRMLADFDLEQAVPVGSSTRLLFENAKANLETAFSWVGLVERFDESMILLADSMGWPEVPGYVRERVGKSKPKTPASDEIRARIAELNPLDVELFSYVVKRFDDHVRSLGEPFQERLKAYKAANKRLAEAAGAKAAQPQDPAPEPVSNARSS